MACLLPFVAAPVDAHPAPFSYLDLRLSGGRLEASLVLHAFDVAYELDRSETEVLEPAVLEGSIERLRALLEPRLVLRGGGGDIGWRLGAFEILPERQSIRFSLESETSGRPAAVEVTADLFPYDPNHQTFLNVYEDGQLAYQSILGLNHPTATYYSDSPRGVAEVLRRFTAAGVHHILIGPDHILFLVGLLLLGGSALALLKIVTAFTVAHSVTLSLAALEVVSLSPGLVEPAIALSIVCVGADNLLATDRGRDLRSLMAFGFGLIHGFGFAGLLREMELPGRALGWSLFSFNVGVEIGQLALVLPLATLLALVYRRDARLAHRIAVAGSVVVIAAGGYWFVQRVFVQGPV